MIFSNFIFRARTVPAIGVIFSEARNMVQTVRRKDVHRLYQHIKKRSLSRFWGRELPSFTQIIYALRNIQPRSIDLLTEAWNLLNRFRSWIAKKMYSRLPRSMKKIVKKISRVEARIEKKLMCIRPRLKRRYGQLVYPEGLTINAIEGKKNEFIDFVKNGNIEDEQVEYIEDCFDDMDRPTFGYAVKITLRDNEPCELNLESPDENTCPLPSDSDSGERNVTITGYFSHYAQSRQTGEGFRSAAPPDCRTSSCGG